MNMVKCPFCHFDNEDGALFCETCKSDLAGVEPAVPVVEAMPVDVLETVPLMEIHEAAAVVEPMSATVVEPIMSAEPYTGEAVEAVAVEAVAVEPIMESIPMATEIPPVTEPIAHVAAPVMPAAPPAPAAPPPPAPVAAAPPPPAAPAPAPAVPTAPAAALPAGAQPRLIVLRGLKRNVEYPIYEGHNFVGRADEKPVDVDLEDQEPPDRVWSSRQHALITFEGGNLVIEDLNSANGTFVNRVRIYPGQKQPLGVNDVVQIGTVQMKVVV
jgi:FHA domain